TWQIEQLTATFVAKPAEAHPLERRLDERPRNPGPVGHLVRRGGPERAEVPARQVLESLVLGRRPGTEPLLGKRKQVGAALRPRPRGWDAHEVDAEAA